MAEVPMMVGVVAFVGDGEGNNHGNVTEHAQCTIPQTMGVSKCEVVSDFMDGTPEGVV